MEIELNPPPAARSGLSYTITVTAKDAHTLSPVPGVAVNLSVGAAGSLDPGTLDGARWSVKTTDSSGTVSFAYVAPTVPESETNRTIWLECVATLTGYEVSRAFDTFIVYASEVKFLTAKFDLAASTLVINIGDSGTLRVNVVDQAESMVAGAYVILDVEPAIGLTLSKNNITTDSSGRAIITYTATKVGSYNITAMPVKTGDYSDVFSDKVLVYASISDPLPPTPFPVLYALIGIVVVAVVIVIVALVAFKIKKKKEL
jgi:hypothetical protein